MTFDIGSLVKWTETSPTRLGYMPSAIGKVVGIHGGATKAREIDVQFDDGGIVRKAFEWWFEPARVRQIGSEHLDGDAEGLPVPNLDRN